MSLTPTSTLPTLVLTFTAAMTQKVALATGLYPGHSLPRSPAPVSLTLPSLPIIHTTRNTAVHVLVYCLMKEGMGALSRNEQRAESGVGQKNPPED